jgi:ABC-2 type transport system ATP-binding protein
MELKVDRLTKQYKNKIAVDRLSFSLKSGVTGLLGENGAGKTTLIRMICGVLAPTSGEITYDDIPVTEEAYRDILGYLPQNFGYYPEFSGYDFLMYFSALKGLNKKSAKIRSEELLDLVGLSGVAKKRISTYSGGMRQRLGIAQALINRPEVLVLDEPTAGLDPKERVRFRNLIKEVGMTSIVLFSTHIVSDVEHIADHVMLMKAEAMVQIASLMGEDVRSSVSQIANAGSLHDSVSIAKSVYSKVQEISNNLVTGMRQVQIVNTRAQKDGISLYDSLAYKLNVQEAETADFVKAVAQYVSSLDKMCEDLELEVMNERARELCFEGKRWYDMLRYNYRHMSGVNYSTLMVDLGDNQAKNYDGFLTLMARKYTNRNGSALVANVKTEPYLYLPVLKSEVEINSLLKQNPAYKDRATAERNY